MSRSGYRKRKRLQSHRNKRPRKTEMERQCHSRFTAADTRRQPHDQLRTHFVSLTHTHLDCVTWTPCSVTLTATLTVSKSQRRGSLQTYTVPSVRKSGSSGGGERSLQDLVMTTVKKSPLSGSGYSGYPPRILRVWCRACVSAEEPLIAVFV